MTCLFFLILSAQAIRTVAQASVPIENFHQTYLPVGVRLGMKLEQLRSQRPNAIQAPLFINLKTTKGDTLEMVEAPIRGQESNAYWYRFKGEKLGAVTKALVVQGAPIEHIQTEVVKILTDLKASFAQKGKENILRSTGATNILLTAQLWENKDSGEQVYLVASNSEITLVFFDPKVFGREHFFVGQEKLDEFEAMTKELSKGKSEAEKPLVDILSRLTEPVETEERDQLSDARRAAALPLPSSTAVPRVDVPTVSTEPESVASAHERRIWIRFLLVGLAGLCVIAFFLSKRRG